MEILKTAKKLGQEFLGLVFPVTCLVCDKEGVYLCDACLVKLPTLPKQICVACHKPAPYGKTHPDCVTKNTVDGAIAGLSYKDPIVKRIIEVFKYNLVSDLSKPLAKTIGTAIAAQGLTDYFSDFVALPIPLHPRRYNWRGFNQSELLLENLQNQLNLKADNQLILRTKFTKPQIKLSKEERKSNMENAFELNGVAEGKKIVLVDDVVTSGATANEIARLLKRNKAKEVWVISVAHG